MSPDLRKAVGPNGPTESSGLPPTAASCAENSEACASLPPSTCATRHTVASLLRQLLRQVYNSRQRVAGLALSLISTYMTAPVVILDHA